MRSTAGYLTSEGLTGRMLDMLSAYGVLVKPRIVLLVAVTGASAMALEGSLFLAPLRFAAVLLGIVLAAASAGALNQYYDRDIDALMARTRNNRPIPAGRITPRRAFCFGVVSGILGIGLLAAAANMVAAALGFVTISWYVGIYTLWLKRRTPLNIVIGGAAGATTPLIGWAAGAGDLSMTAAGMFMVIFLWTPPHFWALALYVKEEYALADIPMLPVVAGEKRTRAHITVYVSLLLPATAWLGVEARLGTVFLVVTTVLGINLMRKVIVLWRRPDDAAARDLFAYSNIYLAAVFALMLVPRYQLPV